MAPRSQDTSAILPQALQDALDAIRSIPDRIRDRKARAELTRHWIPGEVLERYEQELEESGLLGHLEDTKHWFEDRVDGETPRGASYGYGAIDEQAAGHLYALIRQLAPRTIVETGVCNGYSTAVILLALERNGDGMLYSIDLPEVADEDTDEDTFWEGKGGAAIPPSKEPGWVIPEHLRERWELIVGASQDELEPLLKRLGTIDAFVHDSEHSYECMRYEFEKAYPALTDDGLLISDDVGWNRAFPEFAEEQGCPTYRLGGEMAFLSKAEAGR